MWRDPAAGTELLGALTGHASLRLLALWANSVDQADQAAAGVSLGALIAANAPALTQLNVPYCDLDDDGMRAMFEALPHNTHLCTLTCYGNEMSEAFARDVMLPSVRANTSLRSLDVGLPESASAREAEALVAQRPSAN
jgi:hypothetical protein